jgi:hypothetical protein
MGVILRRSPYIWRSRMDQQATASFSSYADATAQR